MNLATLDSSVQRFAALLFERWPAWAEHASSELGSLMVRVPDPPGSNLEHPLTIRAHDDEITVEMGWHHSHFDWPNPFAEDMNDPIWFILALVEERLAVFARFAGAELRMSTVLTRQECVDLVSKAKPADTRLDDDNHFRIRSWRGTLDANGVC